MQQLRPELTSALWQVKGLYQRLPFQPIYLCSQLMSLSNNLGLVPTHNTLQLLQSLKNRGMWIWAIRTMEKMAQMKKVSMQMELEPRKRSLKGSTAPITRRAALVSLEASILQGTSGKQASQREDALRLTFAENIQVNALFNAIVRADFPDSTIFDNMPRRSTKTRRSLKTH